MTAFYGLFSRNCRSLHHHMDALKCVQTTKLLLCICRREWEKWAASLQDDDSTSPSAKFRVCWIDFLLLFKCTCGSWVLRSLFRPFHELLNLLQSIELDAWQNCSNFFDIYGIAPFSIDACQWTDSKQILDSIAHQSPEECHASFMSACKMETDSLRLYWFELKGAFGIRFETRYVIWTGEAISIRKMVFNWKW